MSNRQAELVTALRASPPNDDRNPDRRTIQCPAAGHPDTDPSARYSIQPDGTILLYCWSRGCAFADMLDGLGGFEPRDAFPPDAQRLNGHAPSLPKPRLEKPPPLPEPHRWETVAIWQARSAAQPDRPGPLHIRQEARNAVGTPVLDRRKGKVRKRVTWPLGTVVNDLALYGSWELPADGLVVIVEGEKAADAVVAAGFAAVGTYGTSYAPTASALEPLRGRDVVLWPDADPDGLKHMHALAQRLAGIVSGVRTVSLPEGVTTGWDAADTDAATVAGLIAQATAQADDINSLNMPATVQPPALASTNDILGAVVEAVARIGVAGEQRAVKIIYLVVVTRLLERIVSLAVKGPSSAGKSWLVKMVLRLFPASAFHALSAFSERALIYDDTPLEHRMLVIYEATGMAGDVQTYIVRSLLSEGHVRYITVEKGKGGLKSRTIDRQGPTGLITTTTEVMLHPENETRLLSLTVSDTPEQTRAVLLAHAQGTTTVDLEPWHALQRWLATRPARVNIPYLVTLAANIPAVAVRLRRDFPAVAALIRAHALLHQLNRKRDDDDAIVATFEDYAVVRELVADLVADAAERSVPQSVRETVGQVGTLTPAGGETTVLALAQALRIDKSAASRRVRSAINRGYLRNLEDHRGKPARLALGDPLPEEQIILPEAAELERLHGCSAFPGGNTEAPDESAVSVAVVPRQVPTWADATEAATAPITPADRTSPVQPPILPESGTAGSDPVPPHPERAASNGVPGWSGGTGLVDGWPASSPLWDEAFAEAATDDDAEGVFEVLS